MKVRVGLMGFGRVGRNIFRILAQRDDVQVAAISDIAEPKSLEYLLKYDTVLGRFGHDVALKDHTLHTCGKQVQILNGREPSQMNWKDLGVDVVVEATNTQRSRKDAQKHLDMGAKRVVLCVPTSDAPDATVVMGVNHATLQAKHRIVSNASISAHCALPVLTLLHEAFGLERVFYTAVHAYTSDQRLADAPADDLRRSRAATENIIPTESKTEKLLATLMPALAGKISGMALKVPVSNGSALDMVSFTQKPVSVAAVNDAVRTAAAAQYKGIVEYTADPIVSSDVINSPYSATFDSAATMVLGEHAVKTISWFDNGWGYAQRAVELVGHLAKLDAKEGGLS